MADAIEVLDNLVREELPSVIHESLPQIAPIYKFVRQSSIGVKKDDIGRQWKVLHLFETGLAGLMKSANPAGVAMATNTNFAQSQFVDATDTADLSPFPNPVGTPHVGSIKRTLTLQKATGNFGLPITWQQGDQLSASQIGQVAREVKGVGMMRALTEAQSFFMSANNSLCQVDNADIANDGSGYVKFTVKSGTGRTAFFRIGMMVDFVINNGGVPTYGTATDGTDVLNYRTSTAAYDPLVVADVDYLGGTITVASVAAYDMGTYGTGGALVVLDDMHVVLRECSTVSREMRTWGLNDWIASSGQIMGGSAASGALDLDSQSQFKSKVAAINGPLTDQVMNGYIGAFLDAYPGATIDTILTTMGVTMKYIEQPGLGNNRMVYDRTNKDLKVAGGWSEVSYSFNGKDLRWIISPMCLGKTLYGIKLGGGNLTRYVPPSIGGKDGRVGGDVEFLAPLGGHSNIFKIAHDSSGQSMDMLEAPFWQYGLLAPLDVRSVKLTGLTEATGLIE